MNKNDGVTIPISYNDMRNHRDFSCAPPETLYHYTDLNGASGILTSKSLWLTKIQYLNDTSELKLAIDLFRDTAQNNTDGIIDTEKKRFLLDTANQLGSFVKSNICVASFCENNDLLSQWRGYGNSGTGVAIGFNGKSLSQLNNSSLMNLWKCLYEPFRHFRVIEELIEILLKSYDVISENRNTNEDLWEKRKKDLIGYFNTTFFRVAPVIKNTHFQEEREWRIVTVPRPYTDNNFNVRMNNERVAQYYSLDLTMLNSAQHDFIENIVIGPTKEPELVGDALLVLLSKNGYTHNGLSYSQIPFRSH